MYVQYYLFFKYCLVSTLEGAIKEVWGYKVALFADKCSPCYKLEKKMS